MKNYVPKGFTKFCFVYDAKSKKAGEMRFGIGRVFGDVLPFYYAQFLAEKEKAEREANPYKAVRVPGKKRSEYGNIRFVDMVLYNKALKIHKSDAGISKLAPVGKELNSDRVRAKAVHSSIREFKVCNIVTFPAAIETTEDLNGGSVVVSITA